MSYQSLIMCGIDNLSASNEALLDSMDAAGNIEMIAENNANGNPIYVGFTDIGNIDNTWDAVWKIFKLTYDGNNAVTRKEYASAEYDSIWDDRATYF